MFFGVTRNTDAVFQLLDRDDKFIRGSNPVKVGFHVLEAMPDGRLARKDIVVTSLATEAKAAVDPKTPVTYTAESTGKATFQNTLEIIPGGFTSSGKITANGEIKNPVKFGVEIQFDPYKGVETDSKEKLKKFEKMSRRDKFEVTNAKGETTKYKIDEEVDFSTQFPEGVSSITFESTRYEDLEFTLTASKGSSIHFDVIGKLPVHKALKFLWTVNPGANPDEEKFTVQTK